MHRKDRPRQRWILFMPHVPSVPSSLRVLVWRRMKDRGAFGIQNGVWVLPASDEHMSAILGVMGEIAPQGGGGHIFVAETPGEGISPETDEMPLPTDEEIIAGFRKDRDAEYAEFIGRCKAFLEEITMETDRANFNFAELEENEEDFSKLRGWLKKIQSRDFFAASLSSEAVRAFEECKSRLRRFADAIYISEGFEPAQTGEDDHDEHH